MGEWNGGRATGNVFIFTDCVGFRWFSANAGRRVPRRAFISHLNVVTNQIKAASR